MRIHWRFAKNALANLGRGSATAVVAVLLPPILVRHMTPASYAVWVLVLQTAAYVSYLNFGLQTAVGRYVAYANEKQDIELRDSVFSTALVGLYGAAAISLLCLAVVIFAVPQIFPSVPGSLIPQMRLALILVGCIMAIELPASTCNGVFVGMQRYEIPALTVGGARLISALGIIAAALAGKSLVVMSAIMAAANLLSYVAQYLCLRRIAPDVHFKASLVQRSTARELYEYCVGLTIMSFAMLLVTGFDLVLVGRFDFSNVTPYSVAASMITLISGLIYAIISVVMPHAASLHAREHAHELGRLVILSTRLSVVLLVLTGIPILIYRESVIRLWIGNRYVSSGALLLGILIVANIIRLIGVPYNIILIAAGQQSFLKITPLAEGISNLAASVLLGMLLGARGIAWGTFVGSVVGVSVVLFYSMLRTNAAITLSRWKFVTSGVFTPLLCTSPLLGLSVISFFGVAIRPLEFAVAALLSTLAASMLLQRTRGIFESLRSAVP